MSDWKDCKFLIHKQVLISPKGMTRVCYDMLSES